MKNPLIWIVIVLVLLIGGYFVYQDMQEPPVTTGDPIPVEPDGFETGGAPVSANTIRYGADGFSPASLSVPVGTTVTFVNQSDREMWVASDEHPSHTGYDGTSRGEHCVAGTASSSFDQCSRGNTYSFTFTKAGTFDYHDHANAQYRGTVLVTQ